MWNSAIYGRTIDDGCCCVVQSLRTGFTGKFWSRSKLWTTQQGIKTIKSLWNVEDYQN